MGRVKVLIGQAVLSRTIFVTDCHKLTSLHHEGFRGDVTQYSQYRLTQPAINRCSTKSHNRLSTSNALSLRAEQTHRFLQNEVGSNFRYIQIMRRYSKEYHLKAGWLHVVHNTDTPRALQHRVETTEMRTSVEVLVHSVVFKPPAAKEQ